MNRLLEAQIVLPACEKETPSIGGLLENTNNRSYLVLLIPIDLVQHLLELLFYELLIVLPPEFLEYPESFLVPAFLDQEARRFGEEECSAKQDDGPHYLQADWECKLCP